MKTEIHHAIPRSLLKLYDICFWSEEAAKEPWPVNEPSEALTRALNTFEEECRRYGINHMDVSRGMLEEMIKKSEVEISWEQHRMEAHAGDWSRWGRRGGMAVLEKYGREHFRMLAMKRWRKEKEEMEQDRTNEAYSQGWLDAYQRQGYRLDHGGAKPTLSEEERAYINGYKAGETAFEDDMNAHCYEGGGQ